MRHDTVCPMPVRLGGARVVRIGALIVVSATPPLADDGSPFRPNDLYGQTRGCFEAVRRLIEDVGGTLAGVVRTRIVLRDLDRWEDAARAQADVLRGVFPACTVLGTSGFAGGDWLVETEADCLLRGVEPRLLFDRGPGAGERRVAVRAEPRGA